MKPVTWQIVTHPDERLRHRSEEFDAAEVRTPEFQAFADAFGAFMMKEDGVGLAAPQIGLQKRIIAVLDKDRINTYINPELLNISQTKQEFEEGCLSIPGVYGIVQRPKRVRVRAMDRHGRTNEFTLSGFPATVIQHEIDHLDGILFIDKVKEITKGSVQ